MAKQSQLFFPGERAKYKQTMPKAKADSAKQALPAAALPSKKKAPAARAARAPRAQAAKISRVVASPPLGTAGIAKIGGF